MKKVSLLRDTCKLLQVSLLLLATVSVHAAPAPLGMKEFNKTCPAKDLCPKIEQEYKKCVKAGNSSGCRDFVRIFSKLLPIYDCQRPFDHSLGENYIVPAVWLCDGRRGGGYPQELESYTKLLAGLKFPEARELFGSKEFRDILDGALAEEYLDKSFRAEKDVTGEGARQALAFLEDRCEHTDSKPVVRFAFIEQGDAWAPASSSEFAGTNNWMLLKNGSVIGRMTSRGKGEPSRYMDVGLQQPGDIPPEIFKGSRDRLFSGWAGCPVFKPVVLSAVAPKADNEGWKKVTPEIKITDAIFSAVKDSVSELFIETSSGTERFNCKIGDLYAAEQYSSKDGRSIVALGVRRESGVQDIVGESSGAAYWVGISSGAAPSFMGAGLKLIDFADYDSDGGTEFLFWLSGYNKDGYRIFWDKLKNSKTFSWHYH